MKIKEVLNKLIIDIEEAAAQGRQVPLTSEESAYRRGYLHGAMHRDSDPDLDLDEIELWRQNRSTNFKTF